MSIEEPRSWLKPEFPSVQMDPITSKRPTNAELGDGINQIHKCFEEHKATQSAALEDVKKEVLTIKKAFRLDEPKRKQAAGLSSSWEAFVRTAGASAAAFGGIVIVWKIIAILSPALAAGFTAINTAILTGKLG